MTDIPTLSANEVAFLAEQEEVFVLSRHSLPAIHMIGPTIPRMQALQRHKIPLWSAIILKRQRKCNIVTPEWLSIEVLRRAVSLERRNPASLLTPEQLNLPQLWPAMARMLLQNAHDDLIDSPHEIRAALHDLQELRDVKIHRMLRTGTQNLYGLSHFEVAQLRPLLLRQINLLLKLNEGDNDENENGTGIDNGINDGGFDNHDNNDDNLNNDPFDSYPSNEEHKAFGSSDGPFNSLTTSPPPFPNESTLIEENPTKRRRMGGNTAPPPESDSDSDNDIEFRR